MKAVRHPLENGDIELDVKATAAEVDREFDESRSQFAFDMRLRPEKGKSLDEVAFERLGIRDVDAAVAAQVVERLVPYALDKHDICPVTKPTCTYGAPPQRGAAFAFKVSVVPKPRYELSSYDPVSVEVDAFEFDESLVDEHLARIVDRFVEFEPAPARPVERGDHCFIALEATVDGEPAARLSTKGRVYSLGRGYMPAEFDEGLLGMVPGEKRTVVFQHMGDAADGSRHRALYECEVELLELRERRMPKLADDWVAEHMQGFDTFEQLEASTRAQLEEQARQGYDRAVRERIVGEFAKRFDGELREDAFENAYNAVLADLKSSVRLQGKDFLEYVEESGGEDQVDIAVTVRAREALARDYSLDALYAHLGLKTEKRDVMAACLELNPTDPQSARESMERTGRGFALREVAARHRAARWLVENSTVVTKS